MQQLKRAPTSDEGPFPVSARMHSVAAQCCGPPAHAPRAAEATGQVAMPCRTSLQAKSSSSSSLVCFFLGAAAFLAAGFAAALGLAAAAGGFLDAAAEALARRTAGARASGLPALAASSWILEPPEPLLKGEGRMRRTLPCFKSFRAAPSVARVRMGWLPEREVLHTLRQND